MNDEVDVELDIQLLRNITKEEFLRAVRDGVRDAMPQLYEERIYEIIGEAIAAGIKEFLKKRK